MAVYAGADFEGPGLYSEYGRITHDPVEHDPAEHEPRDPPVGMQSMPDDYDDPGDEDGLADCGLMNNGSCSMAGSEFCDFECPNRD